MRFSSAVCRGRSRRAPELKVRRVQLRKHASVRDVLETMVEGKVVKIRSPWQAGLNQEQTVQIYAVDRMSQRLPSILSARGSPAAGTDNEKPRRDARA